MPDAWVAWCKIKPVCGMLQALVVNNPIHEFRILPPRNGNFWGQWELVIMGKGQFAVGHQCRKYLQVFAVTVCVCSSGSSAMHFFDKI